ncbi:MAG: UrcA family protein [Amphiplicatus sp.]
MRLFIPLAVTIAVAASSAVPAFARDRVEFRYRTAELATEEGAQLLHERLRARAARLCDTWGSDEFLPGVVEECAADLADQWVNEINDPRLSKVHARRV